MIKMEDLIEFYKYIPRNIVETFINKVGNFDIEGYKIIKLSELDGEVSYKGNRVASILDGEYKRISLITKSESSYYYRFMEADCVLWVNDSINKKMYRVLIDVDTSGMHFVVQNIEHLERLASEIGILKGKIFHIASHAEEFNLNYISCKILILRETPFTGTSDCLFLISDSLFVYEVTEEHFPNLISTNLMAKHALISTSNKGTLIINNKHPKYCPEMFDEKYYYPSHNVKDCVYTNMKFILRRMDRVNAKSARKLEG